MKKIIFVIALLNAINCVKAQDNDPCGCNKYKNNYEKKAALPPPKANTANYAYLADHKGMSEGYEYLNCLMKCKSAQKQPTVQERKYGVVISQDKGMTGRTSNNTPGNIINKNAESMRKQNENIINFRLQREEYLRIVYEEQKRRKEARLQSIIGSIQNNINRGTNEAKNAATMGQNMAYSISLSDIIKSREKSLDASSPIVNINRDLLLPSNKPSNESAREIKRRSPEEINEKISDIVISHKEEEGYYYEIQDMKGNCYDVYANSQDAYKIVARTNLKNWSSTIVEGSGNSATDYVVIPIHFTKTITLILEDQEQLADNPQQIPPNTTQTPSNITQKGILRTTPQEYNQEYNYANQKPTQPPPVQSQENKNKDTDTAGTTVNNEGYGEK